MEQNNNRKPDYGNWIPMPFMRILYSVSAVLLLFTAVSVLAHWSFIITLVAGVLLLASLTVTIYMQVCRNAFSFERGGLMGEIHQFLIDHLDWDGHGRLLDIGCGAGALTIRCARKFTEASLIGIDYWGFGWGTMPRSNVNETPTSRVFLGERSFVKAMRRSSISRTVSLMLLSAILFFTR